MKKFLFIPITLLMLFVIVACNRNTMTQEEFDLAIDGVSLSVNVSGDFDLPKLENIKVTWTSDHDAIKFADGKATVTQGAENILVNITATFEAGSLKDTQTYEVTVTGIFNEAINSLSLKNEYYPNEQIFIVTQHKDVTITWSSTSNLVNEIDDSIGVIFLNSPIQDTSITLTATFKRGELVLSKDYEILIKADVAVDVQVSITFVVKLADGVTANDVYLVGDFNGWTTTDANYKLIKDGDKFTGTFTFTATAGEIFSYKYYSHDWELGDNRSINIVDGVTSITRDNDVIAGWDSGNIVTEEFTVDVTFNVTLPNNTPKNDDIFIVGNFNLFGEYPEWDGIKMTRDGLTASITLTLTALENQQLEYKIHRGTWDEVEANELGEFLPDRTTALTSQTTEITIVVAGWEDIEKPKPIVDVATESELVLALVDEIVTEINLTADITLTEKIVIFKNDLTINGHGKKITLASEIGWQGDYIIQVYLANNVLIKDLELVGGDAAILVNGGQLTIENLKLTNQEFGGIEVSQGLDVEALPELTVTGTLYNDLVDLPVIWIDGKTTNDDWIIQNLLDEVEYTEAGKTQLWFTSSFPNEEREVTLTFLPNFPETTPEGTIYLLGTFNDWQKNDDYQLVLVDEVLTLVITVNAKGGDTFEYKYFFEGETPLNFENGNDRVITIGELDEMLLEDTITAWEGIHRIFFIDNTDWNLETISIHIWGVNAIDHTSWDQPLNFIKDDAGFFYYDLRVKDFYSYDYGFIIRDSGGQSDDLKYHPNLNLFTLTGAANNRWIIEVSVFLNY